MTGIKYSDSQYLLVMPADDDYNADIIDEKFVRELCEYIIFIRK